jgi:hypothetical protein
MLVMSGWTTSYGQGIESEVPGDNFSLEGALELFKKSASPEEFEKLLNAPDSKVNNLDLNGDGYIDYIRVIDRQDGNVHAFVLQAVVSERESQDVAVIELEKKANGKAVLQIIGDEDVFGVETIIEPSQEVRTYAGTTSSPTIVNVWAWPSVSYVYGPYYSGWSSPWGWHLRPVWWHRWRPIAYVQYYSIWDPYRPYYSYCHSHRIVYAHDIYRPYRTTSVAYYNRHRDQVVHYRSSHPDGYRSGRDRNDSRRTYADQNSRTDRASASGRTRTEASHNTIDRSLTRDPELQRTENPNRTRIPSTERKVVRPSDRSSSNDRSITAEVKRSSPEIKREDFPARRSATVPRTTETPQVTRPEAAERRRVSEIPAIQQRSTPDIRRTPVEVQRNSTVRRAESPDRNSSAVRTNREIPQQSSRPATVERNRSAARPSSAPQRSSSNRTRAAH